MISYFAPSVINPLRHLGFTARDRDVPQLVTYYGDHIYVARPSRWPILFTEHFHDDENDDGDPEATTSEHVEQ